MKKSSILLCCLLAGLASCQTVSGLDSTTRVADHFVSPPEGKTEAASGPDDRLQLAYAPPLPASRSLTAALSAFDMVLKLGSNNVNVYRYRDPETGKPGYYDAKGQKLGQYLLRNPVPEGRATSGFGMRRHPILGVSRMHAGQDWAAPVGTPIYAAADGLVTFAGTKGGDGRMTVIDHGYGYQTSYSHQSKIAKGIQPGVRVHQGELIGYVGRTGLATGPHLHYEVSIHGRKVNPRSVHFIVEGRLTGSALARFEKQVKAEKIKTTNVVKAEPQKPNTVAKAE